MFTAFSAQFDDEYHKAFDVAFSKLSFAAQDASQTLTKKEGDAESVRLKSRRRPSSLAPVQVMFEQRGLNK